MIRIDVHTLKYLLDFNGRIHYFAEGYWVKFEIREILSTHERPHGLIYSFTLHAPNGKRLLGFDNAHSVKPSAIGMGHKITEYDHWHRTSDDKGRPYKFTDAITLLDDFSCEVQRVLKELGISDSVMKVRDKTTGETI